MKLILSIKKFLFLSLLFCEIIITNSDVQAHPGRTDSLGCHTCRTNCSSWGLSNGEYHCHNAKISAPQPEEPIKSIYGEDGTGYTKPAPEYKIPQDNTGNTESTKTNELSPAETNDNLKNASKIIESTNNTNSSLVTLIFIVLIGGVGYFIGRKKSSSK